MARGLQKGLSDAKDTAAWVLDLLQAVLGILPIWAVSFRQVRRQAIADESLTFREVGNDPRQELASQGSHKTVRTSKGAFATTYDGTKDHGSEIGDAHTAEDQTPPQRGSTGSRGGRGGRKHTQQDQSSSEGCPACEMPHALPQCYYAFPDKAYQGFKPRDHLKK